MLSGEKVGLRAVRPDDLAVEELATGELAGSATLWGIDLHNRLAHLGYRLRPAFRGRVSVPARFGRCATTGSGSAACTGCRSAGAPPTLCRSGRPRRPGFAREGVLRRRAWADGEFTDEVVLGQLAEEWRERNP